MELEGVFRGLKVLEFCQFVAGPMTGMIFADLGADVVRIERPKVGSRDRVSDHYIENHYSTVFFANNRNKKSVCIDLTRPQGQSVAKRMAKEADVIVENFSPGVMKKFGLDYAAVSECNPRVVYCSISGYGQEGPYRSEKAMDKIIQGEAGILSMAGHPNYPAKVPFPAVDILGAKNASLGIMAALYERTTTNKGVYIDLSLFESLVEAYNHINYRYLYQGLVPRAIGLDHSLWTPYRPFMAKDEKYVNIGVVGEDDWQRFCTAVNKTELVDDERFKTNDDRYHNKQELFNILIPVFLTKTRDEWIGILKQHDILCSKCNDLAEVLTHDQVKFRKFVDHHGEMPYVKSPLSYSFGIGNIRRMPPECGQDTLSELRNYAPEDELAELMREGVIWAPEEH